MTHEGNGSILRTHRNRNYKNISCTALDDKELSFRAKGIHTYLITRPDNWKFRKDQIQDISTEGRDSFNTAIEELKERGYLRLIPIKQDDGTFKGYYWDIFEEPNSDVSGVLENRSTEKRESGVPVVLIQEGEVTRRNINKKDTTNKDINERTNPAIAPTLPVQISSTLSVGHVFPYSKGSVSTSAIWYWAVRRFEKYKTDFKLNAETFRGFSIKYSQNIPGAVGKSFEEQKEYIDWFLDQKDSYTRNTGWALDYMVHISCVNKYLADKTTRKAEIIWTDEERVSKQGRII